MRLAAIAVPMVLLCPRLHAQRFHFSPVAESVIQEREAHAPDGQNDRAKKLKELFARVGCGSDRLSEQPLVKVSGVNVICRLPGKSGETIIVGANYNQVGLDNWNGAALLPSLFESLVSRRRHHTFIFVAFADGGSDLAGSRYFVDQLTTADTDRIEAMVDLNALGFSPTKISVSGADKELVSSFVRVMYALKLMGSQVDLTKAVNADSKPFASRNIPQITIHSLTHDAVVLLQPPPLASDPQNPDFAHVENGFHSNLYYDSYRLISGYLAFLDETLKPRRHK